MRFFQRLNSHQLSSMVNSTPYHLLPLIASWGVPLTSCPSTFPGKGSNFTKRGLVVYSKRISGLEEAIRIRSRYRRGSFFRNDRGCTLKCALARTKELSSPCEENLIREPHKYFDQVIITCHAGDGGHGAILSMPNQKASSKSQGKFDKGKTGKKSSYKRDFDGSLSLPVGGHGGDVVIYADESIDTLLEFHKKSRFKAKQGGNIDAMGVLTSPVHDGLAASTLRIPVPLGTVVKHKKGKLLADLVNPGEEVLVARGGQGGISVLELPEHRQKKMMSLTTNAMRDEGDKVLVLGQPGEEVSLQLILRVVADVGLVITSMILWSSSSSSILHNKPPGMATVVRAQARRSFSSSSSSKVKEDDIASLADLQFEAPLKIVQYPDPILRAKSKRINTFDHNLKKLVDEMFNVMYWTDGIGLSAPQVGINVHLMVFNPDGERGEGEEIVLVNPKVSRYSRKIVPYNEGCLSFPGIYADVERPDSVKIDAQDITGERFEFNLTGLPARVFQHEYDHLQGILFFDRMTEEVLDSIRADLQALEKKYEDRTGLQSPEKIDARKRRKTAIGFGKS